MKKYIFQIIVEEGNDEFWESLDADGSTGCEDLREMIIESLSGTGLVEAEVKLVEYTNKD
jgi:hypothetical protein